jgi:putative PIN family toxin of toxin-antitoxin system
VIDNNTLISRLLLPNSIPAEATRMAVQQGVLLLSAQTLQELVNVLNRKKFDKYVSIYERQEFVRKLVTIAMTIEIIENITVCRDPKDNKFLELAVNGKAKFIITGDRDLLILNPFKDVEILTPRDFLTKFI